MLKTIFYALPLSLSLFSVAIANESSNRELLKINCSVNFEQRYGVEHSLLEAMGYAYMGDVDLHETMKQTDSSVGFGFHRLNWEMIESELGITVSDFETSLCENYEVKAWWLSEKLGYNGNNTKEVLRRYYYGDTERERYFAVEAVARYYDGEL